MAWEEISVADWKWIKWNKKIENEESSVLHRSDDGYDWVQQSVGQACA